MGEDMAAVGLFEDLFSGITFDFGFPKHWSVLALGWPSLVRWSDGGVSMVRMVMVVSETRRGEL